MLIVDYSASCTFCPSTRRLIFKFKPRTVQVYKWVLSTYTVGLFPMGLVTQDKTPFNQEVPKNDDEARLTKRVPIAIMSCTVTREISLTRENITYELETSGLVQLTYIF